MLSAQSGAVQLLSVRLIFLCGVVYKRFNPIFADFNSSKIIRRYYGVTTECSVNPDEYYVVS